MNYQLLKNKINEMPYLIQITGHIGPHNCLMGTYKKQPEIKNNYPIYKHHFYDYYMHRNSTHLVFTYNRESIDNNIGAVRLSIFDNEIKYQFFDHSNFWEDDQNMKISCLQDESEIKIKPNSIIVYGHDGPQHSFMGKYLLTDEIVNENNVYKNDIHEYYIYKSSENEHWIMTYNQNDIKNNIGGIKTAIINKKLVFMYYTYNNTWEIDENINLIFK